MRLIINGFGNVGQTFAQILHDKADSLGVDLTLVAVTTRSRGRMYQAEGLNIPYLLRTRSLVGSLPTEDWALDDLLTSGAADVLIDTTPTDIQTGGAALDTFRVALGAGVNVVTVNKGPLAVAYAELMALAQENHAQLLFEGTVMAGTPSIRLAREALRGNTISSARGILNGTTNYILTQMETGMSYSEALSQAQALGYAEPDPSGDVEGWDAAAKVLILSNMLFNKALKLEELDVTGITGITLEMVQEAAQAGERWKLIAEATPDGGRVYPLRLPLSNPLAGVSGATNAITYETDFLGDVTLVGAGAGLQQTGFALLADVLHLAKR